MRELPAASPEAQHQALLEVAEAISQHRDLGELFHELAERLHRVVQFDYLNLILHDAARNVMRLHILESEMPRKTRLGTEFQVGETPSGWVWETQQAFILDDLGKETPFAARLQTLRENGVKSLCSLPLTTAQRRLGVMSFGRGTTHRHHRERNRIPAAGRAASGRRGGQRVEFRERTSLPAATGPGTRPLARACSK